MNANSPNWLQWVIAAFVVVGFITGGLYISGINSKVNDIKVPTASEIAANVVIPQAPSAPAVVVPTAEEIANAINVPETTYSVRDKKISIAEGLATEELMTMKYELANAINLPADDVTKGDIQSISVKSIDTDLFWGSHATSGNVDFIVKVYYNYLGDSEWSKLDVTCFVNGLDRDDHYKDADVTHCTVGPVITSSIIWN